MILAGIVGLCLGAILARHFRALILVPSSLAAIGGVAIVSLAFGQGGAQILLYTASVSIALQIGYFFGLLPKHAVADPPKAQMHTAWRW